MSIVTGASGPAGTRTRYTLDLEDKLVFPDNDSIPKVPPEPDERWVIIADVVRASMRSLSAPTQRALQLTNPAPRLGGIGFMVRDKIGDQFPVIFVTRNAAKDARRYKPGRLICLVNASLLNFKQNVGYFVRDKSTAYVGLLVLNSSVRWAHGSPRLCRWCHARSRPCGSFLPVCAHRATPVGLGSAALCARHPRTCAVVRVGRATVGRFVRSAAPGIWS
jgi:hypothetical protein